MIVNVYRTLWALEETFRGPVSANEVVDSNDRHIRGRIVRHDCVR